MEPSELLRELILLMVDREEDAEINIIEGGRNVLVEIDVHHTDFGKVVGRRGAHADALRTIFTAVYGKQGKRINLQVNEP